MAISTQFLMEMLAQSLSRFLEAESAQIRGNLSERHLCARLAGILEHDARSAGLTDYFADVEYNRKQNGAIKTMMDDELKVIPITTDLILHSRGTLVLNDNLIAIEMKKADRPEVEKQEDRTRLKLITRSSYDGVWSADGITQPEHVCGYRLGLYFELDRKLHVARLEFYVGGKLTDSKALEL